jgi:hypothetical protein
VVLNYGFDMHASIANSTEPTGLFTMTDRTSLSAYIAWMSTCLLSAAVGHLIDDSMEATWFFMGTFGLIAAVGLQIPSRTIEARPK